MLKSAMYQAVSKPLLKIEDSSFLLLLSRAWIKKENPNEACFCLAKFILAILNSLNFLHWKVSSNFLDWCVSLEANLSIIISISIDSYNNRQCVFCFCIDSKYEGKSTFWAAAMPWLCENGFFSLSIDLRVECNKAAKIYRPENQAHLLIVTEALVCWFIDYF